MHHARWLFRISSINSKEVVCFLFFFGGEVNVRRQITFFVGKGFWERLEKNVRKKKRHKILGVLRWTGSPVPFVDDTFLDKVETS